MPRIPPHPNTNVSSFSITIDTFDLQGRWYSFDPPFYRFLATNRSKWKPSTRTKFFNFQPTHKLPYLFSLSLSLSRHGNASSRIIVGHSGRLSTPRTISGPSASRLFEGNFVGSLVTTLGTRRVSRDRSAHSRARRSWRLRGRASR